VTFDGGTAQLDYQIQLLDGVHVMKNISVSLECSKKKAKYKKH
jgi:hypothetical protein